MSEVSISDALEIWVCSTTGVISDEVKLLSLRLVSEILFSGSLQVNSTKHMSALSPGLNPALMILKYPPFASDNFGDISEKSLAAAD